MSDKNIRRAIFLDRDGTLIEDRGCVGTTDDVIMYPFVVEALKMLQKEFLLFIVTNQSCVGLGKISKESADKVNWHIMSELQVNGITIQQVYCCSHKRDDNCECIKPKPFFINQAVEAYNIDVSQSITIGDHPHDVSFGELAGAKGLYVLTGHGRKHFDEVEPGTICFENLLDAARWITGISSDSCIVKKSSDSFCADEFQVS